ncbi:CHAD domain-containing protein [Alsobacter sp. R-9]
MLQRHSAPAAARIDMRRLLDAAAARLDDAGIPRHRSVHEARRAIKVLRALLRLLPGDTSRADADLKALARSLAPARDLRVVAATAKAAALRSGSRSARRLLNGVAREREAEARRLEAAPHPHPRIAGVRRRLASLESDVDPEMVVAHVSRRLAKARRRLVQALKAADPEVIHDARTLTVRAQLQLAGLRDLAGKQPGRRVRRLDRLRDVLGEHHDLAMLREVVTASVAKDGKGRRPALRGIDRRMAALEAEADRRLRRAFPPSPSRVASRLARALAEART